MYSFVLRTHQKIDKVAYKHLTEITDATPYLSLKDVLHFEGSRGPDATRLKRGNNQPPWHFYNPAGTNREFFKVIKSHYEALIKELKAKDKQRAAFEAAWLAHALVDGLTPAHHYPYEEELADLRDDEDKNTRETVRSHFIVKGENYRQTIRRSLKLIGPKGLLTTHTTFELGAGTIIMPLTLSKARIDLTKSQQYNYEALISTFRQYVVAIDEDHMFERFYRKGWTPRLTRDIRRKLAPPMVNIVTLAWYCAMQEAGLIKAKK